MKIFKSLFYKLAIKGYLNWMPDKTYLKIKYRLKIGKKLNLKNPKTFNEKLQWLKLNDRKPIYTKLVDKYEVRKYIQEKIGEEYLIPLIDVYNNVEEINFEKLPNQFVLKCTHDSGGIVICKDKSKLDIEKTKKKLKNAFKRNYFYWGREWVYKDIKPKIICEKYMKEENKDDLTDYKLMCFNGKVKCSFVCLNRNTEKGLSIDFYDRNWNKMPFKRHYPNSNIITSKPDNYERMIELAEILSKEINFVRVDFYEIDGKLYFGELTFFPGSGFEEFIPEKYDTILGEWINI